MELSKVQLQKNYLISSLVESMGVIKFFPGRRWKISFFQQNNEPGS